jgi:hypothetical protein
MKPAQLLSWLLISAIEIFLIGSRPDQCPDMANYLSHPGINNLSFQPDDLLYYLLHLSGSNSAWVAGILVSSVAIYNLAALSLNISQGKKLILISAPFSLSILATHFWSCAIRSGLSISVLILAISMILQKASTNQSHTLIQKKKQDPKSFIHQWGAEFVLFALSIVLHWSTSIIIAFLFMAYLARDLGFKLKRLLIGRVDTQSLITIVFALVFGFAAVFYIIDKLGRYQLIDSVEYGRSFPIVNAYMAVIVLTSLHAKRQGPINEYNRYFSALLIVLSFSSFLGLSGNLIRLLAPLSLIMMYLYVIGSSSISRLLLSVLACSPPFLYYTLTSFA